jgi:hypothetical protein
MSTPRRRVDLKKILPVWAQYALAIVVAAVVMALAWRVGHDAPDRPFLNPLFLAIWRWVALTVVLVAILAGWLGARSRRKGRESNAVGSEPPPTG